MKVRLGDVCTIVSGSTPKSTIPEYWDGDIKWITPAELSNGSYIINDSVRHITVLGVAKTGLKSFPAGTVILSSRAPIGKTAIAGCEMFCNQGFKNLICSEKIDSKYLYYFLSGKTDYLNSLGRGATFKEISKAIVENIEIPLPEVEEQKRIAARFERLWCLIQLQKAELEELDKLVKSRFIELFGDPSANTLGWPEMRLEDACIKLTDGTHFSPESFATGEYKYITAKHIKADGFDFSNLTYVPEATHRPIFERCNPEYGDILYIKDGATTGIAMINTLAEEFTMLSSVALIKYNRNLLDGQYLKALLNYPTFYAIMRNNMGGAAITRLTVKKLCDTLIPVPPIDNQKHFSAFVGQTDKSKFVIQQALDKAQLLFDSLMQKYFG